MQPVPDSAIVEAALVLLCYMSKEPKPCAYSTVSIVKLKPEYRRNGFLAHIHMRSNFGNERLSILF